MECQSLGILSYCLTTFMVKVFYPMSDQNSSGFNLRVLSFLLSSAIFCLLQFFLLLLIRQLSLQSDLPLSHLLQLNKAGFLNLSSPWLSTHCGRALLASFQCVNICHVPESPNRTQFSGLVMWILNRGKNYSLNDLVTVFLLQQGFRNTLTMDQT